ncbi:MAG: anaerobic ribonucleoside-triphosphate reductase activating protein [Eubacteriales bacterium]
MKIAGFAKTSFVDYPGKIACVVFTPFCNMKCQYCHNKHILYGDVPVIDEKEVFEYLNKRKDMLGAVVITGGEPTIQKGLAEFIKKVKQLGLLVKLDTNGTNPDIIKALLEKGLLDYIAMDVKAPLHKYFETVGCPVDVNAITASIDILLNSAVPYEFRTTFSPTLTADDIVEIGELVRGTKAYFLQQYKPAENEALAHNPEYVLATADRMRETIGICNVRGL